MKITLERLTLKNFKGVRDLSITFGNETFVYGDNATGKTTIFDAFLWLLFDKDSQNKKDFEIKTLDANGKVLPGLDHEVEGTLTINGRPLTLRKVYSEKWTKKRGSATSEFTGHTTDYFVDGVPVKLKEYKDRVEEIGDENIFKLLTNPSYFNEVLDWKERRKVLLEIAGDVSDAEVIHANDSLANLPAVLNGHTLEDHRKIIAARRTEINKELDKIPVRIDEAQRSKPDTATLNETELSAKIARLQSDIEAKEMELSRIQSGGEIAVQERRLREIEGELIGIKNQLQDGALTAVRNQRNRVQEIENAISQIDFEIRQAENRISSNNSVITSKQDEAERLKEQWYRIDAETFQDTQDTSCPACGQELPVDRVKAAHDKALTDFNVNKSELEGRISATGKRLMAEVHQLEQENERLQNSITKKTSERETEVLLLEQAKRELEGLQTKVQDVSTHPDYIAKQAEYESVSSTLQSLRESVQTNLDRVRLMLMDLRSELRAVEAQKASFTQVAALDERIAQLGEQERKLTQEYERLEEQLYMTEEFIRTKVSLLESRINGKFQFARFKLFETQINGGLQETCHTLYHGVPYGSGLNNAARINVGLDIINTLSEHYDTTAPIFVDNAEAVTSLIPTRSQTIALYVSEADKTLRIESNETQVREAI